MSICIKQRDKAGREGLRSKEFSVEVPNVFGMEGSGKYAMRMPFKHPSKTL